MKRQLFFDLDGTLIDSSEGIYKSIIFAMEQLNLAEPTKETLRKFIGPPLKKSFELYCQLDGETADAAVAYYRENYGVTGMFQITPYEDIIEVIEVLSQTNSLYIATSKPEKFAREILNHLNLSKYFEGIYGADLLGKRSEKAEVISYALAHHPTIIAKEAIMIGDREHDILGGKENGMQTLGVLYGFGSKEELLGAGTDQLAARPKDILCVLEKFN
ncbi:hydrolase [Enterococcus sp. JM4C]|uniref:HAD hydrolase-like protein n=1 Tax=Candidatus Enterococcus huntleyi TaxID=1857217 RepID=UPI00137AD092|nr:HAD hydrolase-like protein [Enterococcus sp. JM4C]KAF1296131.1 hydrolase [Enterococcus sp. JM4C]